METVPEVAEISAPSISELKIACHCNVPDEKLVVLTVKVTLEPSLILDTLGVQVAVGVRDVSLTVTVACATTSPLVPLTLAYAVKVSDPSVKKSASILKPKDPVDPL
jgi:hypothetical protein